MLQLGASYTGEPEDLLDLLPLQTRTVLIYPSIDTLVIRDARTLKLERILSLWEVFPSTRDSCCIISDIVVDSGLKLVGAVSGSYAAFWYPSGKTEANWRVHSSITADGNITSIDCKDGLLVLSTERGLSLYNLSLQNDLPTWSKKNGRRISRLCKLAFSPALTHLAGVPSNGKGVYIIPTASLRTSQKIPHPRAVTSLSWRRGKSQNSGDIVLCTITSDMVLRVFAPVLDSPTHLQLQAAMDTGSVIPLSERYPNRTHRIFLWDPWIFNEHIRSVKDTRDTSDYQRMEKILNGDWDLFAVILVGNLLVLRGVINIDSRPPTLLRQFNILQLDGTRFNESCHIFLPPPAQKANGQNELLILTWPPLKTYLLDLPSFLSGKREGLSLLSQGVGNPIPTARSRITNMARTPDGSGFAVQRSDGGEAYALHDVSLKFNHRWGGTRHVVVLNKGKTSILYVDEPSELILSGESGASTASLAVPPLRTFFSVASDENDPVILAVTQDLTILQIRASKDRLEIISTSKFPLQDPHLILPVDPMAWATYPETIFREMFLCASSEGELTFWAPENETEWTRTGIVHTGRQKITMARCSSAKKTVLVTPRDDGEELSIWDSKESEFAAGLEYGHIFSDAQINDLDWTSTQAGHSILAVGFTHEILLLCEQRMTYFDQEPAWRICHRIDISSLTSNPISDSIWLAHGSLMVGTGHQLLLYNQQAPIEDTASPLDLFDYVNRYNSPLPDYHPQMLLQCLLWNKVSLAKEVIVRLASLAKQRSRIEQTGVLLPKPLDIDYFTEPTSPVTGEPFTPRFRPRIPSGDDYGYEPFGHEAVKELLSNMSHLTWLDLSTTEQAHLTIIIQSLLEAEEQRRALDENGLRYLISLKSFVILNQKVSATANSPHGRTPELVTRHRMRYRDFVWAFHSESQEILLQSAISSVEGKLVWNDARALGIFLWLKSHESLRSLMEKIAQNQYLAGEVRDPVACSLLYFALGKHKLVHGLWKRAAWHEEQQLMLKFLSNDFSEPRWKTAALKNAYALLGKQRPEYAAAFFLLGGSLIDAVNVCIKQLKDFQLAVALARVVEKSDDGPVLSGILQETVVPLAFKETNRWLGSWAFWSLRKRDLALKILITPLKILASELAISVNLEEGSRYDDTSLALLFSQLKSKSLQTLKGASEISGQTEFNFVIQIARVFCRMGCHVLALDLVKNWSFTGPDDVLHEKPFTTNGQVHRQLRPEHTRRQSMGLRNHRRQPTVVIDMDLPSDPPTRSGSPTNRKIPEKIITTIPSVPIEQPQQSASFGSLLKAAKQVSRVAEFDLSSFGDFSAPSSSKPAVESSEEPTPPQGKQAPKANAVGNLMAPKKSVVVPEFDMNSFF